MDPYAAEEAAARSTRVYPWWAVVAPLLAALLLLWFVALRPFAGMFAPDWQPAPWYLLGQAGDTLLTAVEYSDCDGPVAVDPETRFDVEQTPTEVRVDTYVAVTPSVLPGSCPKRYGVVAVHVPLEEPLGDRALSGCRHEHSLLLQGPSDGCDELPEEFGG